MSNNPDQAQQIQWLRVVIATVAFVLLGVVCVLWAPAESNRFGQLVMTAIPSAMVVLATILVVYFIFTRHGIKVGTQFGEERLADVTRAALGPCPSPLS